jgi:hypothetical protein
LPVIVSSRLVELPAFNTLGVSMRLVDPAHEGESVWFEVSYSEVRGRLLSIPVSRLMPSV